MPDEIYTTALVVRQDGREVKFARLTMRDIADLAQQLTRANEAKAKKLAEAMSISNYDLFNVLADLATRSTGLDQVLAWAASCEGADRILRTSLDKSGVELSDEQRDRILDRLGPLDGVTMARSIVTHAPSEPAPKEPEKNDAAPSTSSGTKSEGAAADAEKAVS